jgi:hypothetical protein
MLSLSFISGFVVSRLAAKYKAKILLYFYGQEQIEYPPDQRLDRICDAWLSLRTLLYAWRSNLSARRYAATQILMSELDELLAVPEEIREKKAR